LTALIVGMTLLRLSADIAVELAVARNTERQNLATYREQVKKRIKDEVDAAVTTASFLWDNHYGDVTEQEVRQKVARLLESLHRSDVGYYFGADYGGVSTVGPAKGQNMLAVRDKNGVFVVQELIKTAQGGGGFVEYVMPPIDGYEQAPKISYVLPFAPFGWYIGAGVSLTEIESIEREVARTTRKRFITITLANALLAGVLLGALTLINRLLYRRVGEEILSIEGYLSRTAFREEDIRGEGFCITELGSIAEHSNRLVHALFSSMKELRQSRLRFETVVRALPDLVFMVDRQGRFLSYESVDNTKLLASPREFIGKTISDMFPPDISESSMARIEAAFGGGELTMLEYSLQMEGQQRWYEARFVPVDQTQLMIMVRDTTEISEIRRKNEYLSYHDQLTKLYNRRFFEEEMHRLDSVRHLPLSIVMIDVNGLKMINDAFGHAKGDELLTTVSDLLSAMCRSGEIIARTGGDEFVILLPSTPRASADAFIRRLYDFLEKQPKEEWITSISVGFDTKEDPEEPVESVYAQAEKNMYRRKLAESQSMRNQTVQVIMRTLNEKNRREKRHSERVSALCRRLGEALGMDYQAVRELETAGLLHDIGKIVVDEKLLNKAGPLTEAEYDEVKKHPEISYQILRAVDTYATIAEDILSHHERWDGTGYPRGLSGAQISLTARIIAVSDTYEAMTATRTYRQAQSHDTALEEIRKNAGTQFDPEIVKVFVAMDFSGLG